MDTAGIIGLKCRRKPVRTLFRGACVLKRCNMNFDIHKLRWTREPADYSVAANRIEIITKCKWPAHDGQQPDLE